MNRGAFALIDALGFKGIWEKHSPETVVAKLSKMALDTTSYVEFTNTLPGPVGAPGMYGPLHVTFLSDTIAIAAELGTEGGRQGTPAAETALKWLVLHVSTLLKSAALTDPPLAYRGCISFGEFLVHDRFIIGPAVDQAAKQERLAEGAFVWLDDSTKRIFEATIVSSEQVDPEGHNLHRVRMPTKNGQTLETFAVLPFGAGEDPERKRQINDRILASFDSERADVVIKKENTTRFLLPAAEAATQAFLRMNETERMFQRLPLGD